MNFKPTFLKSFASALIGLASNLIFMNSEGGCRGIYCYYPGFVSYEFLWIFVLILTYIIWSLFEKKKIIKSKARKKGNKK